MGRPEIKLDFEQLDKFLQYKPSLIDVAEFFKCSVDTIENKIKQEAHCTFSEYRYKKMAKVRLNLTQKAIQLALNGDRTMLIFCLKNLCGWADMPTFADEPIDDMEFVA